VRLVTGASRFLIGLVTCFATHDGIPAVARSIRRLISGGRPVTYDRTAYSGRNVIEPAFNGFSRWRGLATGYDKHAIVYRGGLVLAPVLLQLTDLGDTSQADRGRELRSGGAPIQREPMWWRNQAERPHSGSTTIGALEPLAWSRAA